MVMRSMVMKTIVGKTRRKKTPKTKGRRKVCSITVRHDVMGHDTTDKAAATLASPA